MNLDSIISRTCKELPYSKEIVEKTLKSYNRHLEKSLNAVQLDELSVPYLGTFVLDQTKFFRKLLRTFVILRKLKDKMKLIEKSKSDTHFTYKLTKRKYDEISVDFKKLWDYKQSKGWKFTYSVSKSKRSKGYFQKSYKQKEERDKQFADYEIDNVN